MTTPAEAAYETAQRALCRNAITEYHAGVTGETDEYLALNRAVYLAAGQIRWWRRSRINRRVCAELDYWAEMSGAWSWHPVTWLAYRLRRR